MNAHRTIIEDIKDRTIGMVWTCSNNDRNKNIQTNLTVEAERKEDRESFVKEEMRERGLERIS